MKHLVSSDSAYYLKIKQRLRSLGASAYVLSKPEVEKLASLLDPDETIEAFVYGVYGGGWGMLVATDKKLIFVDKIFFGLKTEELPYSTINSIDHKRGRYFSKVMVRARSQSYSFKRVRCTCGDKFARYVKNRMDQGRQDLQRSMIDEWIPEPEYDSSSDFHIPTYSE